MKERENIAVLGPAGTFCDQALAQYRAKTGCKDQALYCASIEGVFHAVAEGCQRAVVPIENTLDGYVQVSLDGLLETKARITGELYVPVQFALVGNVDSAKDSCTSIDFHIISDGWSSTFPVSQRHHLETIEIIANGVGIEIGSITMFEMCSFSYMRAPDSHGSFWRQQPTDEHRAILSQSIIEEVTETSFTSASLDEVQ